MISQNPAPSWYMFASPTHLGVHDYSASLSDALEGIMTSYYNLVQARWQPEAIDCTGDKKDLVKLSEAQKNLFILNLLYQTMMDTGQARMPDLLKRLSCDPRLEMYLNEHAGTEAIHARSYTYMLNNLFNADEVQQLMKEVFSNTEIVKRASTILNPYKSLEKEVAKLIIEDSPKVDLPDNVKELVLDCCMTTFILESLRFNNSFVCSFSFKCQSDSFTGITSIMKLIARDENVHVAAFLFIIRSLLNNSRDSFYKNHFEKNIKYYENMWKAAMEEEISWANYIFSKGPVKGLDADILTKRIYYVTQKGMKLLNIPTDMFKDKNGLEIPQLNPTKWVEEVISGNMVQHAPQAASGDDYMFLEVKRNPNITKDLSKILFD